VCIETNPGPSRSGRRLTEKDRWKAIIYNEDTKLKPTSIARKLKTTPKTVLDTIHKYEETGTVHDRPGRGRKRIYSAVEEKKIVKKAKKRKKAPQIAREMGSKSSARTIQRILKEKGLFYGKVQKIEKLTDDHKKKRVAYAKEMKNENWRNIVFSDEKTFQLGAGSEYAWQTRGDREVEEYVRHAPKLNVWGAIGAYIKTPLYFFKENMDAKLYQSVLKQRIKEKHLTYASDAPKSLANKWLFLQDGARPHTAKKSIEVIHELIENRLHKHPAKSPDLNPMEDMWSYLDRKVKDAKITTIPALKKKLTREWNKLTWTEVRKSVDSMSRRLQSCVKQKGNRLPY
jgi:transposase